MGRSSAWHYAYFPYSVAFSILSILIPLYLIDSLGGSLLDLGLLTSATALFGIPASIFFGRLPDRFGRTKPLILASFLSTSLLIFLLSEAKDILTFQILYISTTITDSLHTPSTNVLIAESYHKESWGRTFARYNFVVGIASALGLAISSVFITSIGYRTMLWICGPLVLASFIIALLFVEEPPIYVERWISRLERPIDEVTSLAYQLDVQRYLPGETRATPRLEKSPRMVYVGLGFMTFSLAATCTFTSLPIYLTRRASIQPSTVFTIFLIRSIIGTFCYIIAGKWISLHNGEAAVKAATGMRILLALSLPTIAFAPTLSPLVATIILSSFASSWSLFSVGRSTVIAEYASDGSLGSYEALDKLGNMVGGLLGGLIPAIYGFDTLFVVCSALFASAFLLFIRGLGR